MLFTTSSNLVYSLDFSFWKKSVTTTPRSSNTRVAAMTTTSVKASMELGKTTPLPLPSSTSTATPLVSVSAEPSTSTGASGSLHLKATTVGASIEDKGPVLDKGSSGARAHNTTWMRSAARKRGQYKKRYSKMTVLKGDFAFYTNIAKVKSFS